MASIAKRKSGMYNLRFVVGKDDRRTMALGTRSERQALKVKLRVEDILAARQLGGPVDPETAVWLGNISAKMRERLVAVGLIDAPQDQAGNATFTLGCFLDAYLAKRTDVKQSTLTNWEHTKRNLLEFFGSDRGLASITAGDAKDFERFIKTEARKLRHGDSGDDKGLKPETVRKRISNAKLFFGDAVARELIPRNPFAGLKSSAHANRARDYFITREAAEKIIKACPDAEWRLIFALSRFGGLRCPSEHLALRWSDVDWEHGRLTIHSPKTEHHEGKASRVMPIFPELRPHLNAVSAQAAEGAEFIITRYRDAQQNLRTTFQKIIRRAGLTSWPKLFQNLRRQSGDGTGSRASSSRGSRVVGPQHVGCTKALLAGDRCRFRSGDWWCSRRAPYLLQQVRKRWKMRKATLWEPRRTARKRTASLSAWCATGLEPVTSAL